MYEAAPKSSEQIGAASGTELCRGRAAFASLSGGVGPTAGPEAEGRAATDDENIRRRSEDILRSAPSESRGEQAAGQLSGAQPRATHPAGPGQRKAPARLPPLRRERH